MKAIEIIMLPVSDQQQSKTFYQQLGFEVIVEAPMPNGETWLQMALPGSSTSIALMKEQAIICKTADIDKSLQEFKNKGIAVGAIDETPWGKFSWLKDPDGNALCLHEQ